MKARHKWDLSVLNNEDYEDFRMLKLSKFKQFCIMQSLEFIFNGLQDKEKKEIFFGKIEESTVLVIIRPNYDSEDAIFLLSSVVYYL